MSGVTPNLGLTKWTVGGDYFSRATLAANDDLIDAHDHTSGKGVLIPTGGLANLAVTTPKIADLAVTTAKIAAANVTLAKMAAEAWTAFTPTITTVTLGTGGSNSARYVKIGRTVHAAGQIVLGTGGSFTGASVTISVPFTSANTIPQVGTAAGYDSSGSANMHGYTFLNNNSAAMVVRLQLGGSSAITALGATTPMTWAVGDILYWAITYEAAS